MIKLVFRDIRSSLGRWIAIFAITALGIGFLAGLIQSCPAMLDTIKKYVKDTVLYDWRVVLPDGFDAQLLSQAEGVRGVRAVESAAEADALTDSVLGSDQVLRFHSVTQSINKLTVRAGRLPERPDECFADICYFPESAVGSVVTISDRNDDETRGHFAYDTYTIVGVGNSPVYINFERGTTALGSGNVLAFVFIPRDGFTDELDTELFLALETEAEVYSESYDRILRLTQQRLLRFAREQFPDGADNAYLLSRNNNTGFSGFESDAQIVAGIARVFPIFFFLIAALVCVTTMTRMVDEQRTQIGVMRALGFGPGQITGIYLLYSGSAALLGCVAGFFLGIATIPQIIWKVYNNIMYRLGDLVISPDLALGALLTLAFVAVSCLATALAVSRELRNAPAQLLRPRPPKAGRRLLFERIPGLAGRLDLLWTVSLRNVIRDRGRLFMTVVGVAGCTALLLAAYGIRDSIAGITDAQFNEVTLYDYLVAFTREPDDDVLAAFDEGPGTLLETRRLMYQGNMDLDDGETVMHVTLAAAAPGDLDGMLDFHRGSEPVAFPAPGEALICTKLAEVCRIGVGDAVMLRAADGRRLDLVVSGVFDNYFYNFVVTDLESFDEQWGETPERQMLVASALPGSDIHKAAAALQEFDGVAAVMVTEDTAARVDQMMLAIRYIVILVIFCSGALAFVVVYNLTNINIIERVREIATVKVLGFYARESAAYVFRETLLLTALGALIGIPLGRALHRYVMAQIHVNLVYFDTWIAPVSYLYALLFTFLFVVIVDVFMFFRLERIHMAEALKSNE